MAEVFAAAKVAEGVWAIAKPFAKFIACAAVGVGLVLSWEHKSPLGLGHRLAAAQALAATNAENWRAMKADRDGWRAAQSREHDARLADAARAADAYAALQKQRERSSSDAFDQGYAAGKVAARTLANGAAHATPLPAAGAPAGGLRHPADDLAGLFARGAYQPDADPRR